DMLGSKTSTFGPKLGVLDCPVQPVAAGLTVQLNVADPVALVVSVAGAVVVLLAAVVGGPDISPVAWVVVSPAGSPRRAEGEVWGGGRGRVGGWRGCRRWGSGCRGWRP